MTAHLAFTEWKPKDAAAIVGVSPDLQRQWRRLGMLDRLDGKRAALTVIDLAAMAAGRSLIDAGAGQAQLVELHNVLTMQTLYHVLVHGRVRAPATLTFGEILAAVRRYGLINVAEFGIFRYLAFRNDSAAIGSKHRYAIFDKFDDLLFWMSNGHQRQLSPQEEAEGDRDIITGEPVLPLPPLTPEELEEQAEFEAENPSEPPLPPAEAVVLIDIAALGERLLRDIERPYAQVWDDDADPILKTHNAVINQMSSLYNEELQILTYMSETLDRHTRERGELAAKQGQLSDAEYEAQEDSLRLQSEKFEQECQIKDLRVAAIKAHLRDLEEEYRVVTDRKARTLASDTSKPLLYFHGYQFGWKYLEGGGSTEPVLP